MTQIPAGWYPDPAAAQPGMQQGQRYWDGQRWTEHMHAPTPYAPMPAYPGGAGTQGEKITPDGQRLAGWWARVAASLIDSLILTLLILLLAWPFWAKVFHAYGDFIATVIKAAETGASTSSQTDLLSETFIPILAIAAIGMAINFVYNVGFLRWMQATPGKLALGLRVRRRDVPGTMPWATILLRWMAQNWSVFFGVIPILGSVFGLYPLLDCLWPLWDSKNQALHDKVAKTNVVTRRR